MEAIDKGVRWPFKGVGAVWWECGEDIAQWGSHIFNKEHKFDQGALPKPEGVLFVAEGIELIGEWKDKEDKVREDRDNIGWVSEAAMFVIYEMVNYLDKI